MSVWELYDLLEDPDEMTNLYGNAEYADITQTLKAELIRLKDRYAVEQP